MKCYSAFGTRRFDRNPGTSKWLAQPRGEFFRRYHGRAHTTPAALGSFSESDSYRAARNDLLHAEIALRRSIEDVAALRRKLPLGGAVPEDYSFEEGAADLDDSSAARKVHMSELFEPGKDTLTIYSFIHGPSMASACTSCTSVLDGLNGSAPHVSQRINFAVVAKSPIERIRAFARERGWHNLRLLSSASNTYNRDYFGEGPEGNQLPSLNVSCGATADSPLLPHRTALCASRTGTGRASRRSDLAALEPV